MTKRKVPRADGGLDELAHTAVTVTLVEIHVSIILFFPSLFVDSSLD
jgi:hypothetical protein